MAWLQATPKPPAGSKRAELADHAPKLSRLARMKKDGVAPPMPPNPAPHIIDWLTEIGLVGGGGMGAIPVSWQEIVAWQSASGVRLEPWVARLIHRLSTAYVAFSRKAEEENCPPPWRAPVTQRERDTEEARLRLLLG
ncbi:hypothetical protein [Sphingomonas koreensis]|nr:hypothetical protein [Sphingomonas koreensis]